MTKQKPILIPYENCLPQGPVFVLRRRTFILIFDGAIITKLSYFFRENMIGNTFWWSVHGYRPMIPIKSC